jgi:hypothetical protein
LRLLDVGGVDDHGVHCILVDFSDAVGVGDVARSQRFFKSPSGDAW